MLDWVIRTKLLSAPKATILGLSIHFPALMRDWRAVRRRGGRLSQRYDVVSCARKEVL